MENTPYLFDEFFASDKEESVSPFLTPSSKKWGRNLPLKSALLSAFLLLLAFIFSFTSLNITPLLLTFVFFFSGTPALIDTFEDIKALEINIDVLMTLAAFMSILIGSPMEGALLLVLFALSGAMEKSVSMRSKSALHHLHEITPHFATLSELGRTFQKSVKEISVGSCILVKAGEIVPLDGLVLEGASTLNLVHLTGESLPQPKKAGDDVQAGSRNLDGTLLIQVTKSSSESTLSRILKLIDEAQSAKPKVMRLFDRFSKAYSITIILLSALFALTFPFLLKIPFLTAEGSLYRSLAFLIAASPCALIIATPTAYLSALSAAAKKGILLKGGVQFDALAACDTLAFDKTGTLTTGELKVTDLVPIRQKTITNAQAISLARELEKSVTHPISTALIDYAKEFPIEKITDFHSHPGYGLEGKWEGKPIFIGHRDYILSKLKNPPSIPFSEGEILAFLLIDEELFLFKFSDKLRPHMKETIKKLKSFYKILMYTGDHEENASFIAKSLDIANYRSSLKPDDKMKLIAKEKNLAMVGDGINDAPALTRANVGISLGKIGSDTAIDASDIILLNDDLELLVWLTHKAKKTLKIVKQNLVLALGVIFLATTPALLGYIPLYLAVILHEGGTILVGLNSLRLLKK
ncbi:MAG: heavy metal translocating P-type ATPase [Simkaniaceae bacterium]